MAKVQEQYWTTEITPNSFAKGLGLRELWQKKYLIWLFIKRDITVQFKQTIFGMGWYFISPLFTMFMYIVVFGRIAEIRYPATGVLPQRYLLVGVLLRMPDSRFGNLPNECQPLRQSLFPATCFAGFGRDV